MKKLIPFILFLLLTCIAFAQNKSADLILVNGKVYTVNKKQPWAEAVVVKDGKIVFVGKEKEARTYTNSSTEIIDCKGQFVMPGFIEGHGHIHGLGSSLMNLDLMNAKNWDEIVNMVAEAVKKAKPGDWIFGRGWHQEKWNPYPARNHLGYPYHEELDKVSPKNPVILVHASGHSSYVNAKALELGKVDAQSKNPTGGDIVKDKEGKLVGVLEERAQDLVLRAYYQWQNQKPIAEQKEEWIKSIELAEQECLRNGVTSFQDAGSGFQLVEWMKELAQQGKLSIRHWLMVRAGNNSLRQNAQVFPIINEGNGFLTVKAIKVSLDGALGSYGAWLIESYEDRKEFYGQNTFPMDSLRKIAEFSWEKNLQLCVHAIGDRANRETINIFSEQIQKDKKKDHRWRVEHAQHVNPTEIPRFKQWHVIASMQSIHCTSDAPFVEKRLGAKRAEEGAYMWKAFLKEGVVVTNGTDVPVEKIDPFDCYYAAVTRKQKNGVPFYPNQKMTREEAVYSYTMANAYAAFEEKQKGSLEPGKYADIVVLSNNLINCKEEDIKNTKVLMTFVGGKLKYSGNGKKSF